MKARTLLLAALAMSSLSGMAYAERVVCESEDERYRECPVNGDDVRIVRQLSKSDCIEGRTWGRSPRGIYVDDGCRAEFEVRGRPGHGGGRTDRIVCESEDERRHECRTGPGEVRLVRQLSRSTCIEHRNWGRTSHGIYVDDGCRAEFEIRDGGGRDNNYGNNGYGNNGYARAQHIVCESDDGRRAECASGPGRVRLVRQLSKTDCVEYRNWGRTSRGIFVDDGCRAEFEVTDYRGR